MSNSDAHVLTPERFKALADGVFSIAMTLLIIDVVAAAKEVEHGVALGEHLLNHWGVGAAFLVGFLTIFVCWVNHHAVLDCIDRVDRGLLWIGGLQLGMVSAIPLPTALLADHLTDSNSHTAFFLYGVTFLVIATSFWALTGAVLRGGLMRHENDRAPLVKLNHAYLIAIGWNVLCLLALELNLLLALPMWAVMFWVFAFPAEFAHFIHSKTNTGTSVAR